MELSSKHQNPLGGHTFNTLELTEVSLQNVYE
jgi:hypothetical protein